MPVIRLTPAVKVLLIACVAVFVIQHAVDQFMGGDLAGILALSPGGFLGHARLWQIFTYSFLHADPMQLFLNLMMLVFIGAELEGIWGTKRFLRFYFACSVFAGLTYVVLGALVGGRGLYVPMMGSSAGVYGLLVAYGILFSERTMLFMMIFPMKARHFVWVLVGIEFLSSVFSGAGGLPSIAHLGGMAAGAALLYGRAAWRVFSRNRGGAGQRAKKTRLAASHLKLVKPGDTKNSGDKPNIWH